MTTTINIIIKVISIIATVISAMYFPKWLYIVAGFFTTRKFAPAKTYHKYAILIAARNESAVIANLLDSIKKQDYPGSVTTFVVADNCTDNTAEIVRNCGALCYERFDPDHRTKGYALQFLFDSIWRDYGRDAFEGYFVFDADNLLKSDYISRMNDAFDAGEKIVTSYRNTKNFDDNWISASYALHWMRTIRTTNRGTSWLRLTTRLQGTGMLFASETLPAEGWIYTSLTEDRAFSADAVVNGYRISYQNTAEFYDEQPVQFRQVMRQRIRWAKGHIQAFFESGGKLFVNIFKPPYSLQNFCSYDMLLTIYPRSLFSFFRKLLVFILRVLLIVLAGFAWGPLWGIIGGMGLNLLSYWAGGMGTALYVMIFEHQHVPKLKWYRALWHILMFPVFDKIGSVSTIIALFMKVEWKPIYHKKDVNIDDLGKK
ncbi:MAG: glycosyltransferase [Clostridia bacterium]|nr:glycosyltransferase [Clostridia bacterium]MBR0159241.1 glycosyltransferase [Clostridia bacterium]